MLDPVLTVSQPRSGDRRRRLRRDLARRRVVRHRARGRACPICLPATRGGCSRRTTSGCSTSPTTSRRAARCCSARTRPGIAIEQSMLGATHACANPLTARYGTTHGVAIARDAAARRAVECGARRRSVRRAAAHLPGSTAAMRPGERLAERLEELARAGGLPATLRELGVPRDDLPALAADAATQWTGTFNPRPFDAAAALALYERAF